ncbi:MAG: peptidoglycan-binding protein [Nostoc sp. ChiSLP02]|nr:peptidoglycan-binding protein [Nostoc sp. DedSLP05]MDZ8098628.1 peptidoglycan-binding protein [Nostoc sp. DedSLP01]MDZ8183760.1 peptidoglycan-binding protein [Nostoc sp. ChiSLP02]
MVDNKGTGWIPDYPDVRDYHIGKIKDRLGKKFQDIQITNDIQEPIAEILDFLKNSKQYKEEKNQIEKIEKIEKTIRGGFKLVKVKPLKNQSFLVYGSVGYEVYEFQRLLLSLDNYKDKLENIKEFSSLMKSIDELKQVFYFNRYKDYQTTKFPCILEYGYFGKKTEAAVNEFNKVSELLDEKIDGSAAFVDQMAFFALTCLNQILELKYPEIKDNNKLIQEINPEEQKKLLSILDNLNELKYFKFLSKVLEKSQSSELHNENNSNKNDKKDDSIASGSWGDSVIELQSQLIQLEELNGLATGYFDSLTEQSVRYFQAKYGLKVDGIVGQETRRVLRNLVTLKNIPQVPKTRDLEPETREHQKRLIVSTSSPIPIELYEVTLKIFQISEFEVKDFVTEKGFQRSTPINGQQSTTQASNPGEQLQQENEELQQTIDLIVKWIYRIISPLAQHPNLEIAVKNGLKQLDKSFEQWLLSHKSEESKKQQQEETIQVLIDQIRELQKQIASEKFQIDSKLEPKKNLLKEWDSNPLFILVALSRILSFKKVLNKIENKSSSQFQRSRISKTIQKTNEIFKSLIYLDRNNLKFNLEERIEIFYRKSLRTVIQILPDEIRVEPELERESDLKRDLENFPIEWDLEAKISRSQEPKPAQLNNQKPKLDQQNEQKIVNLLVPEFVDLSFWCSPIEDQGSLDSCTAHAGIALMEYFEKRSFDRHIDASRLFLYKVTRNLMHRQGDVGASLRETMKAMALFGVPPEEYWPYEEDKFDEEPTNFCYSFAQSYQALKYFRLNPAGTSEDILLFRIKTVLAAGFPCAFGFTIYDSIDNDSNQGGHIPYPVEKDKVKGGHAAVAVGYEDYKVIENADGIVSQGALLIRNSWGKDWGEGGYGWLPYDYVLKGLTADWWSLLKSEWFETKNFGLTEENNLASDLGSPPPPPDPEPNPKPTDKDKQSPSPTKKVPNK